MYGQKLGYLPLNTWVHHRSILLKEPAELSLVVESPFAVVLAVKAYDMCVNFPEAVRNHMLEQSVVQEEFVKMREEQIFKTLKPAIVNDIELTKLHEKTK